MAEMIAYCGLDCSGCECRQATQADDDVKRAEVARDWSARYNADIKPEQIVCDGCRAGGRLFFYCSGICEIRKCGIEKDVEHCALCDEFACDKLEAFFQMAPQARTALEALRSAPPS